MSHVIPLARPIARDVRAVEPTLPVVRTDAVHVVFTSPEDTLAAVRVAARLAGAMCATLRLVHFRTVPYRLSVDAPAGLSPVETDEFKHRLASEGFDVRVRVYLCRNARAVIAAAFRRRSIVVIGGRRCWWPTAAHRVRRALEAAGHYVMFVDAREHQESSRA